jgi:hypothetical protein
MLEQLSKIVVEGLLLKAWIIISESCISYDVSKTKKEEKGSAAAA